MFRKLSLNNEKNFMARETIKHVLHCMLLIGLIVAFMCESGVINLTEKDSDEINPWEKYGTAGTLFLYSLSFVTLFQLPHMICVFLGLILYNAFSNKVILRKHPMMTPFICIRVVTRGDYPDMVKANVLRNIKTCLDIGLKNFTVEVVANKPINLPMQKRVREIVVPENYATKNGALFKSRSLQYCLEDNVNILKPNDWIVHLDEETILTVNCVKGIINFVTEGKFPFGQGLVTYASENVVNWVTTISDGICVTDDMGKTRFQFKMFHKPLFGWKGTFMVAKFSAERDVSFDHGADGSIIEDIFFGLKAFSKGYSFDWIEGEMCEKSAITILDFLKQRKRWFQGIILVVNSKSIPIKYKLFVISQICTWCTMPLQFFVFSLSLPSPLFVKFLCAFLKGMSIYLPVFGVLKTVSLYDFGILKSVCCIISAFCLLPLNGVLYMTAMVWGSLTEKHKFFVTPK